MLVSRASWPVGEGLNWRRTVCHAYQVTVTRGSYYKHVVGGGYLVRAPPPRVSCPIEKTAVSYNCEVPSQNLSETTLEECTHTHPITQLLPYTKSQSYKAFKSVPLLVFR